MSMLKDKIFRWLYKTPFSGAFYLFILVSALWLLLFLILGSFTSPAEGDEAEYITLGHMLIQKGIVVLADGYRPPLFPIWISFLNLFIPDNMMLASVRFFNVLAMALVPALWWWGGVKRVDKLRGMFFFMALFSSIWAPLFFFSFPAYAEAGSFLFLNILIITLLGYKTEKTIGIQYRRTVLIVIELFVLFSLKTNNILIAVPVALFVLFTLNSSWKNRISTVSLMTAGTIILILPWILFLHQTTGKLRVTTTGGVNLLIGTGYYYGGMSPDSKALPDRYIHNRLEAYHTSPMSPSALSTKDSKLISAAYEKVLSSEKYTIERAKKIADLDAVYVEIARKIWLENRDEQVVHGLLKVAHSYGFSMRGGKDFLIIIFLILVMIASLFLWRDKRYKKLIILHWSFVVCGLFITFFFLPPIRFKTYYFDSTGLLVLAIFANYYFASMWNQFPKMESPNSDK